MAGRIEIYEDEFQRSLLQSLQGPLQEFGDAAARDAAASLQTRNRPSRPGETPSVWNGALQTIAAAVEDAVVVVGVVPQIFRAGGGTVPALLEAGGVSDDGHFIAARPYLQPAFLRRIARGTPSIWQDRFRPV